MGFRKKVSIFASINRFMENERFIKIGNELPISRKKWENRKRTSGLRKIMD